MLNYNKALVCSSVRTPARQAYFNLLTCTVIHQGLQCMFFSLFVLTLQFIQGRCLLTWWAAWPGSSWTQHVGWTLACPSSGSCSSHRVHSSAGTNHFTEHSGKRHRCVHLGCTNKALHHCVVHIAVFFFSVCRSDSSFRFFVFFFVYICQFGIYVLQCVGITGWGAWWENGSRRNKNFAPQQF